LVLPAIGSAWLTMMLPICWFVPLGREQLRVDDSVRAVGVE